MIIEVIMIANSSYLIFWFRQVYKQNNIKIVYRVRVHKEKKKYRDVCKKEVIMNSEVDPKRRALRDAYMMMIQTKTEQEMIIFTSCKILDRNMRSEFDRKRKGLGIVSLIELCVHYLILNHKDETIRKETIPFAVVVSDKPTTILPASLPNSKPLARIAFSEIPREERQFRIETKKEMKGVGRLIVNRVSHAPAKGSDHSALKMDEHEPDSGRYSIVPPKEEKT